MRPPRSAPRPLELASSLLLGLLAACGDGPDVVVYCALDQVHAENILRRFEQETGLTVDARFDIEANKTVGLVQALREESGHTRCDVFWNNEIVHTVALADEGLLAKYRPVTSEAIPAAFRDPGDRWTGFAARARVLIVNTDLVPPAERQHVRGMEDLFDPRWHGRVALARPLAGTTLTHFAALYSVLGAGPAEALFQRIEDANESGQLDLATGNAHVMRKVREGAAAWGWTDTDDFNVARLEGSPVAMVVPDQGPDGVGALLIPNTLAVLEGAPHPDAARKLVDWLLREEIEAELARSRSAQIPVRSSVPRPEHVLDVGATKLMQVDFLEVGRELQQREARLKELFVD